MSDSNYIREVQAMNAAEAKSTAANDAQTPPSENIPRRSKTFYRCLAAVGMTCAAFGLFDPTPLAIDRPGAIPLLLLFGALLVMGPPRRLDILSKPASWFLALLCMGLVWPLIMAWGLTPEKEAALLSLPNWLFVLGAGVLGWSLRQQTKPFAIVVLIGIAVLRLLASYQTTATQEIPWWIVTGIWTTVIVIGSQTVSEKIAESPPLLAGIGWFVLLVCTLTFQEYHLPQAFLASADDSAALNAWLVHPLGGWGSGSIDRVLLEFTERHPRLASFRPRVILQLLSEIGVLSMLAMIVGGIGHFFSTVQRRPWKKRRLIALGTAGFWIAALLTAREETMLIVAVLAFILPSALGQREIAGNGNKMGTETLPPFAWEWWTATVCALLMTALIFPITRIHFQRQNPDENLATKALLAHWSIPYREQSWLIRRRSGEIAQYSDPVRKLEPVVEAWLDCAPHDERALVDAVRLNEKKSLAEGERMALEAHRRNPWSPIFQLWVVRLKVEQGKRGEAIHFLDDVNRAYGPIEPAVQNRLNEMQIKMIPPREEPAHGNGN